MAKVWKDHLGNEFKTCDDLANAYGINKSTLVGRLRRGETLEQALTMDTVKKEKDCIDHLGNKYKSLDKMDEAYNINRTRA